MARENDASREEFRVVLTGVRLSDEQREAINTAVQQAALRVVADLDFGGDQAAALIPVTPKLQGKLPPWWDSRTWGIWWIYGLPDEQFERLAGIR